MNYVEVIDKINKELESNGVNTIYALIANNIEINVIENIIEKNASAYGELTSLEKKDLCRYIKGLKAQSKLIGLF